jgi:hypothetical protein
MGDVPDWPSFLMTGVMVLLIPVGIWHRRFLFNSPASNEDLLAIGHKELVSTKRFLTVAYCGVFLGIFAVFSGTPLVAMPMAVAVISLKHEAHYWHRFVSVDMKERHPL